MKPVLVLAGPTCVGKTSIALEVAQRLGNAALINADSRQLFSGLHVGTATPTKSELHGVRAELFGIVAPGEDVSLATWLGAARQVVDNLVAEDVQPIIVGGTGLFITAFSQGYELIPASMDPVRRDRLNLQASTPAGLEAMRDELKTRSPATAAKIDMANPRRVIRAMELLEAGAQEPSPRVSNPPSCMVACIDADRELHRQLIATRSQAMFVRGALIEEVRAALDRGVSQDDLRRCGIGYSEALDVLAGAIDQTQALNSVIKRTVRYAKVQRTWFRHHRIDHNLIRDQESTAEVCDELLALWRDFSS